MSPVLTSEIAEAVERLPVEKRRAVLDYARGLSEPVRDRNVRLDELFGSLSEEDAEAMLSAIEEECERVDAESW